MSHAIKSSHQINILCPICSVILTTSFGDYEGITSCNQGQIALFYKQTGKHKINGTQNNK